MADADASEGFDPRLQSVFEQEILHQWSFAEFAINLMNERVDGPSDNVFWFA